VVRNIDGHDTWKSSHGEKITENVPSVPGFPAPTADAFTTEVPSLLNAEAIAEA
jgi:hypothetical protein